MVNLSRLDPSFLLRGTPQYLIYFVTARCNCRCRFCFFTDRIEAHDPAEELTLDEVERFASQYGPIANLAISGGEPFLRKDLSERLRILATHARPRLVDLPTNGSCTSAVASAVDVFCSRFPETLLNLQLSVDGPAEVHDAVRGMAGLFDRLLATNRELERLARLHSNLRVQIITVCSVYNRDALDVFLRRIDETLFFHRIILNPVYGGEERLEAAKLDPAEVDRLQGIVNETHGTSKPDLVSRLFIRYGFAMRRFVEEWEAGREFGRFCKAGRKILVLGEQGEVYPCEPLWKSIGNIRDHGYDIRKILESDAARAFQREYQEGEEVCHCTWSCAQANAPLVNPKYWLRVARALVRDESARACRPPPKTGRKE